MFLDANGRGQSKICHLYNSLQMHADFAFLDLNSKRISELTASGLLFRIAVSASDRQPGPATRTRCYLP